jgi:outer membrane protein TolC
VFTKTVAIFLAISLSAVIPIQTRAATDPTPESILPMPFKASDMNEISLPVPTVPSKADSTIKAKSIESDDDNTDIQPISLRGIDTPDTLHVGIQKILDMMDEDNVDLEIAQTHITEGKWGLVNSVSHILPSFNITDYKEVYHGAQIFIGPTPFPVDRSTYQAQYRGEYDIQTGGKGVFDILSSRSELKRQRKLFDYTNQQVIYDILSQYTQYLRDIANIEVAKEGLRQAQIQLRISESRYHAGFTTKLDVTQTEALVAERKGGLVQAESQKAMTEYALASSLTLPLNKQVLPEDPDLKPWPLVDANLTLIQLFQKAIANRPDLKSLDDAVASAKNQLRSARAEYFPTVSLSAYNMRVGPYNQLQSAKDTMASISFDMLRYMGMDTFSRMMQDKAKIEEAQLNIKKQILYVQRSLSQAYINTNLYKSQMEIAEQKVNATLESFRISRHRRLSGIGINLEVVQAQKDLSDARQEYYTAIMNYNNAELKLLLEIGDLTPKTLVKAITKTLPENGLFSAAPTSSNMVTLAPDTSRKP